MTYRYSGHGAFTCRYTWLPKAARELSAKPGLFSDDDDAMVRLGVGKNMVRAIRFWADSANVAKPADERGGGWLLTPFGEAILSPGGLDEYLEDVQTLWLIHWQLSTSLPDPVFAWNYLLNHWHKPSFTRSEALLAFEKEALREDKTLSPVTLEEHLAVFIRTYVSSRDSKKELVEESLDCPLVELALLQQIGERVSADSAKTEAIYAFRIEDKPEISTELFTYCLDDYWRKRYAQEQTLSFNQMAVGEGSPGQVFKLPEHAVRERLEIIDRDSSGVFAYQESAARQVVSRRNSPPSDVLLKRIYRAK